MDVSARISKQGSKFLQQVNERAALNELMTAVGAKDASALITLFNITKVPTMTVQIMCCSAVCCDPQMLK